MLIGSSLLILIFQPNLFNFDKNPTDNTDIDDIDNDDDNSEVRMLSNLSLMIDFGNDTIIHQKNFSVSTTDLSVFWVLSYFYKIEYDSYSNGQLVTSINGRANNPTENLFWFFWVNDVSPNIASSRYILESGDIILWNYTSWNGQI